MLASQKIALAAQMHVMLRRKTGRVTDTEWMAENADYAREVVRFARLKAREAQDAELGALADRLEQVLLAPDAAPATAPRPASEPPAPKYIGGIR